MEISLMQCILIGIWTGICITGMLTGTYLTRCLVMAAGELAFLGFGVSSGGSVPPNPVGPGIIGTVIAVTMKGSGVDTGAALAYSFPFAILIQFLITGIYTVSTGLVPMAERAVERGQYRRFRLLANGTFLMFVCCGFVIGFTAAYHVEGLERLIAALPEWLTAGLGTAGKMLPAVGFAVILSVMADVSLIPFALIGYVAAAYAGLPVLGVAAVAVAAVWLVYERPVTAWLERRKESAKTPRSDSPNPVFACPSATSVRLVRTLSVLFGTSVSGMRTPGFRKSCRGSGERAQEGAAGGRIPEDRLRRLSRMTALRAYLLQNGYNYGNYEGLAYANIMYPALRRMCADDKELRRELRDSMGFCSTNPNFLPVLTSMQLVMFNRGITSRESRDVRVALMGPFAGVGDSVVQFCFAPVFSTIGASMAQEGLMAGPVVFLLGMNLLLLNFKLLSESVGFRLGHSMAEQMKENMHSISRAARMLGTAVITGLAVSCVDISLSPALAGESGAGLNLQKFLDTLLPGALPIAYTGLLFYLIRCRKCSMYRLVILTVLLGILLRVGGVLA